MNALSIVFSLLLTAAIYMAFPILFAVLRKKPIRLGIYRLVCWIVAIVIALIVQILTVSMNPDYRMTFVPAVLWTSIGIAIGKNSIHTPDADITRAEHQSDPPPSDPPAIDPPASDLSASDPPSFDPSASDPLSSETSASRRPKHSAPSRGVPVWIVILLVLVIGILLGVIIARPKQPSGLTGTAALEAALRDHATPTPRPTAKPTPTPAPTKAVSGTVFIVPRAECLAPFTVEAPTDYDCFVRLHYRSDPKRDVGIYVRAGDTASVDVPLGVYELYYATGLDWQGAGAKYNLVFGPDTQWHTSNETFRFYDDGEYYNGHTVTLYSVLNGNWSTETIDEGDLPF